MVKFNDLLVEGRYSLDHYKLICTNSYRELDQKLHDYRDKKWKKMKQQNPLLYNGDILIFDQINDTDIFADLMKFADLLTMLECKEYGEYEVFRTLGCKFLLWNENRFLTGRRSSKVGYRANYYSTPGGMFEISDCTRSLKKACFRELSEEVRGEFTIDTPEIIVIGEDANQQAINIIITAKIYPTSEISGNNEWKDGELKFVNKKDLAAIDPSQCTEELVYVSNYFKRSQPSSP